MAGFVLKPPAAITQTVEITRSFSYKLNMERYSPEHRYESRDFFCSQKTQCAPEEAEEVAILLHAFCKRVVMHDVRAYVKELRLEQRRELANGRPTT